MWSAPAERLLKFLKCFGPTGDSPPRQRNPIWNDSPLSESRARFGRLRTAVSLRVLHLAQLLTGYAQRQAGPRLWLQEVPIGRAHRHPDRGGRSWPPGAFRLAGGSSRQGRLQSENVQFLHRWHQGGDRNGRGRQRHGHRLPGRRPRPPAGRTARSCPRISASFGWQTFAEERPCRHRREPGA